MKILNIKYYKKFQLKVELSDGVLKIIDLENFIKSNTHPAITKYKDLKLFKNFKVDQFGSPCWGDNEFDISPESIIRGDFDKRC
ncbi:MAG TPA: DUF2442 domain-containing protein [Bacteroidales bacterium]|nr:DUF2442 domain-containing protein [Bacteroidales bacterium]